MTLTTADYWEAHWASVDLPVEIDLGDPYVSAIVSKICSYLSANDSTIAALGAAPGGYLAFFAQRGLLPVAIERSTIGCEKISENWRLLGVSGRVLRASLFDAPEARHDV